MLLQFSVENFRSFKNKMVLSLEASRDREKENHVIEKGKERILKSIAIFGANAAGKSNLFAALTAGILLVRRSNDRQIGEPLSMVVPFKFSNASLKKPTVFEFVFIANEKKYVYRFSANSREITQEYLYVYHSVKPSTIFERDISRTPEYHFTNMAIKKELEPIISRNTPNKLFLATATAWNAKSTQEAFLWFNRIDTYSNNYSDLVPRDIPMFEADTDHKLSKFICKMLKKADINISDYEYRSEEISIDKIMSQLPQQVLSMVSPDVFKGKNKTFSITMTHRIADEEGKKIGSFQLNMNEESQGTRSLFMLSPLLYEAFHKGKIICVDEFDTSLHPLLVGYLVSLFHDPEINKANAQLIVSSHTTTLLSRDVSRDDEIYFVEKDNNTGESELYSLDEFSPRKQMNIRKAYLLGRFGAIPDIDGGEILW